MLYPFISEEEQFSCNSTSLDILLTTHSSQKQPPEVFGTLLKWDSNTVIFQWNLLKFLRTPILTTSANDCSCAVWFLSVVVYKCRNTKKKTLNWTFFSLPLNKKNPLCEEHFEESCFNKSVDLGKRLKAIKIYLWLISFLIDNI